MREHFRCAICGENYYGYGNNAEPVSNGRCCDTCDQVYVIPKRISLYVNLSREKR